ncbi:MAG TPA: hypothetical protein PKM78_05510 [Anaerolineae bacterium]|nr:hypothetical protein [Anaerolineae bacterium]HNU04089.1 hypothetical protein [Anaerolineae bacterium]
MSHRPLSILSLALVMALLLTPLGAGSAAASGDAPTSCPAPAQALPAGPVVVQGWVINHRELPVDGTRTPTPLTITAIASNGATVSAAVGSDGFFRLSLTPDVWDFQMQLPDSWDGIVPLAPRAGLASTGCTPLPGRSQPYLILFKIRRLFDVTALKWEELAGGTVQAGAGWRITFQPVNDPFAVRQVRTTDANGAATAALTPGVWSIYETARSGWTPVTPSAVTITLDQYAPPGVLDPVVFKNRSAP